MRRWTGCLLAAALIATAAVRVEALNFGVYSMQRKVCAVTHIAENGICAGGTRTNCRADSSLKVQPLRVVQSQDSGPASGCEDAMPCPPYTSPGNRPCIWACGYLRADASAAQVYRVAPDSIFTSGTLNTSIDPEGASSPESRAGSDFELRFAVALPTDFHVLLSATVGGEGSDSVDHSLSMTVHDAAGVTDSLVFQGQETRPHSRRGILQPGAYTVQIRAAMHMTPNERMPPSAATLSYTLQLWLQTQAAPPSPVLPSTWTRVKTLYQAPQVRSSALRR